MIIRAAGDDGVVRSSRQLIYIADGCSGIFLSQRVCKDLGMISENFPEVGVTHRMRDTIIGSRRRSSSEPPQSGERILHNRHDWIKSPSPAIAASLSDNKGFEINEIVFF